jgi:hypothetical protein|nr:hypothetical protein [uncultured Pedobacter sp.]
MKLTILILIFGLLGCNRQIKFDKKAWTTKDDFFPCTCRQYMIEDLKENYKLTGINEKDLIKILGQPDQTDSSIISYQLIVDYDNDIDPTYTKTLTFKVDTNKTISNFEITEWKK